MYVSPLMFDIYIQNQNLCIGGENKKLEQGRTISISHIIILITVVI